MIDKQSRLRFVEYNLGLAQTAFGLGNWRLAGLYYQSAADLLAKMPPDSTSGKTPVAGGQQ